MHRILSLLLLAGAFGAPLWAAPRTWTSADGRTLVADLVTASDQRIVIRRASDGTTHTLLLSQLSRADAAMVREAVAVRDAAIIALQKEFPPSGTGRHVRYNREHKQIVTEYVFPHVDVRGPLKQYTEVIVGEAISECVAALRREYAKMRELAAKPHGIPDSAESAQWARTRGWLESPMSRYLSQWEALAAKPLLPKEG